MSTPSANTSVFKIPLFLAIVGLVGIVALAGPFSARVRGAAPKAAPRVTSITQVTHDGFRKTNLLADDSELFVTELPAANRVIAKVSLPDSGRSLVASPFSSLQALDLSADRSRLLVAPIQAGSSDDEFWTLPVGSGSPQRIGDLAGRDASWSADGKHLVFSQGAVLYVAGAAGTEKHELYTANGSIFAPHFSLHGQRRGPEYDFDLGDRPRRLQPARAAGELAACVECLLRQLDGGRTVLHFPGIALAAEHEHKPERAVGITRLRIGHQ